jgi:hypothetical protein
MKKKLSKEKFIELISQHLELGSSYTFTLDSIGREWTLSESTFKRYWNIANNEHKEAQNLIKKATEVQTITNELNRLKTLNLTKIDRMIIAEKIAMGKAKRIEGQIIVPSPADQLKALDYLSKIEGDYAPTKTAQTDVQGNNAKIKVIGIEYID